MNVRRGVSPADTRVIEMLLAWRFGARWGAANVGRIDFRLRNHVPYFVGSIRLRV